MADYTLTNEWADVDLAVSRVKNQGWGIWYDTEWTSTHKLDGTNIDVQITNNGEGALTETSFLPANGQNVYEDNAFSPPAVGCYMSLRLTFTAVSTNHDELFDIEIRIPTIGTIWTYTLNTVRGAGQAIKFDDILDLYCSQAMLDNGFEVWLNGETHGAFIEIYDISFALNTTYSPV